MRSPGFGGASSPCHFECWKLSEPLVVRSPGFALWSGPWRVEDSRDACSVLESGRHTIGGGPIEAPPVDHLLPKPEQAGELEAERLGDWMIPLGLQSLPAVGQTASLSSRSPAIAPLGHWVVWTLT